MCDSVGESSLSAWKAAEKLWPEIFTQYVRPKCPHTFSNPLLHDKYTNLLLSAASINKYRPAALSRKEELLEKMRLVRPVVETGYENVVQIRALYDGVEVDDMLANWHTMLPELMKHMGHERSELVALFGGVRDHWIKTDLKGWLAPNR